MAGWLDNPLVDQGEQSPGMMANPVQSGGWMDNPLVGDAPGMLDYIGEAGKRFATAVAEGPATSLRGAAALQQIEKTIGGKPVWERTRELAAQGVKEPYAAAMAEYEKSGDPLRSIAETPAYRAGEAMSGAVKSVLGEPDVARFGEKNVPLDVASGLGSFTGNVLTGAVPVVGLPLAVGSVVTQGMGEGAERAVKAKATPQQQLLATGLGSIPGATDFVDVMLPKLVGVKIGALGPMLGGMLKGTIFESAQEGIQQFLQNLIAKGVYKPDQEVTEDVLYNALIGGLTGGIAGGGLGKFSRPESVAPTQEDIAGAILPQTPVTPPPPVGPVEPELPLGVPTQPGQQMELPLGPEAEPLRITVTPRPQALGPEVGVDVSGAMRIGAPPAAPRVETPTLPSEVIDAIPVTPGERGLAAVEAALGAGLALGAGQVAGAAETYMIRGVGDQPDAVMGVTVTRGADGGMDSFTTPLGTYQVPAEARMGPPELTIAMKYGPRSGVDQRSVTRVNEESPQIPPTPGEEAQVKAVSQEPLFDEAQTGPTGGTYKTAPKVNARAVDLMETKLYGSPRILPRATIKEMFQNGFDAIKDSFALGMQDEGNIDITIDSSTRIISFLDDGKGMTPQTLSGPFLDPAGTEKVAKDASGGLGVAKVLVFRRSENIHVTTMRNGVVSEMQFTGEQYRNSFTDPSQAPEYKTRTPTPEDRALFPKGHGTKIEIRLPSTFIESGTRQAEDIHFPSYYPSNYGVSNDWNFPVLTRSPLLRPIAVRVNGEVLPVGKNFPIQDFTPFITMSEAWGAARVHVSSNEVAKGSYDANVHVLSNGIWQFSDTLKAGNKVIPRDIYIDVASAVEPHEDGYPFDLNRQGFAPQVKESFEDALNTIAIMYQQEQFNEMAENFGGMQFLSYNIQTGRIEGSGEVLLKPTAPPPRSLPAAIKKQNNVITVAKDGELLINGQKVPELSRANLKAVKIDTQSLKIPQDQIPTHKVVLHDNQIVDPTGAPLSSSSQRISMTQYGVQKFGDRFYEYLLEMGNLFHQLRDVVADFHMPLDVEHFDRSPDNYSGLREGAVGLSLDSGYRGVNIRLPFSGVFLNPFLPIFADDPRQAGLSMVGTMIHELAHHGHRSEELLEPVVRSILIQLTTHPTFNARAWAQNVIDLVNRHHDMMMHMRGMFEDGHSEPRGKRLEISADEAGVGRAPSGLGEATVGAKQRGQQLSDWVEAGQAGAVGESRPQDGYLTTSRPGDSSFGRTRNQRAYNVDVGHPDAPAFQRHAATAAANTAVGAAFGGNVPQPVQAAAAHADAISWTREWFNGLLELTASNIRFTPLIRYTELVQASHRDESGHQDGGVRVAKDFRSLGPKRGEILSAFVDDIVNMVYRTPAEVAAGHARQPTPAETAQLAAKHKVDAAGLAVWRKIQNYFEISLQLVEQVAEGEARRLLSHDPVALNNALNQLAAWGANLRHKPFFPFLRFGTHYITVKDSADKVQLFEMFERKGIKGAESQQQERLKQVERLYPASGGFTVKHGVMPKDVGILYGLPPTLLKLMEAKLQLTPQQLDMMKELQYQTSPTLSFKHRFQHKNYIPGYSKDFIRAFSHYAFFNARYYARVKYVHLMREQIDAARAVGGNKATRIANYMEDHLQHTILDARGDWGLLKGIVFLWAMGYVPAAATANLTQTPMITFPHAAAKFGSFSAVGAMTEAIASINTLYRRGYYPTRRGQPTKAPSSFEMKALGYGIKTGRISETQAPELASMMQHNLLGFGGSVVKRGANRMLEQSAVFFELAEQFNRRIAYRTALKLAMAQPKNKYVDQILKNSQREYNDLINIEGFSPQEARAVLAANVFTEETQIVYARYARPRVMRHPAAGAVLIFKRYIHGVIMLMLNNKRDTFPRFLAMSLVMGGLSGIIGLDDAKELAEALINMTGVAGPKRIDLDLEARKYIMQWFDGQVPPDIVLQGLARRGFGIPWLLDTLGSYATGHPGRGFLMPTPAQNVKWPYLDRSKAITQNPLLPIEIGKMMQPFTNPDKVIAEQTQRASGAVFGVGFNMYKALLGSKQSLGDMKRWEVALPRALGAGSKAFRTYIEERSRGSKGGPAGATTNLDYDVRDPEQLAEIIFQGMGYQTLRESQERDIKNAQEEHKKFIEGSQKVIYEQFWEAVKGGTQEEIDRVGGAITKFNSMIAGTSDAPFAITERKLKESLQSRALDRAMREQGLHPQKRNIPAMLEIEKLFPERVIDVKRVR